MKSHRRKSLQGRIHEFNDTLSEMTENLSVDMLVYIGYPVVEFIMRNGNIMMFIMNITSAIICAGLLFHTYDRNANKDKHKSDIVIKLLATIIAISIAKNFCA